MIKQSMEILSTSSMPYLSLLRVSIKGIVIVLLLYFVASFTFHDYTYFLPLFKYNNFPRLIRVSILNIQSSFIDKPINEDTIKSDKENSSIDKKSESSYQTCSPPSLFTELSTTINGINYHAIIKRSSLSTDTGNYQSIIMNYQRKSGNYSTFLTTNTSVFKVYYEDKVYDCNLNVGKPLLPLKVEMISVVSILFFSIIVFFSIWNCIIL